MTAHAKKHEAESNKKLSKKEQAARKLAGKPKTFGPKPTEEKPKATRFPQKDPTREDGVEDGQKGPKLDLPYDRLNAKELKVLHAYSFHGAREVLSIEKLAELVFPNISRTKANSWVRNSLRRLVRGDWIENTQRGHFRLTLFGVRQLRTLDKKHELKKLAA